MRAQGIAVGKSPSATNILTRKRGPGRPPKSETIAMMQAQLLLQHQQEAASSGKRGRGRPRKDGSAPIPRKLPTKSEISAENLYVEAANDYSVERSRSGRKIQRTQFHDEMEGGGLMRRDKDDDGFAASGKSSRGAHSSMYVAERSAAAAAKSAIAGGGRTPSSSKKEGKRKPGARECMQITRKFGTEAIDEKHFDILMVSCFEISSVSQVIFICRLVISHLWFHAYANIGLFSTRQT